MALPNSIDKSTPTGSTDPGTLDTIITGLKTAVEDIVGIPDATSINAAVMEITASGCKNVRLYDATADAATAGYLQRNGSALTFHDGTSAKTLTTNTSTQTLTNKTLTAPVVTVLDNALTIQDNADPTKQFQVQCSGITAGQTRTMTVPDADFTAVGTATTQTLTNKTLTDPTITGGTMTQVPITQNSQSAAYTTVLADGGKHILHPTADNNARTFTIDSNANVAYPVGTAITFVNEINTVTIAITSDTLMLAGIGSTGSRTLAANGIATALKIASTKWIINGTGLS